MHSPLPDPRPPAPAASAVLQAEVDVGRPVKSGGLSRGGVQQVVLNGAGLVFADAVVPAEDIAGIQDAGGSVLFVHAYPRREAGCGGGRSRRYVRCSLDFAAAPQAKDEWLHKYKEAWGEALSKPIPQLQTVS